MRRALASLLFPAFYQSFVLERINLVHNFRSHFSGDADNNLVTAAASLAPKRLITTLKTAAAVSYR